MKVSRREWGIDGLTFSNAEIAWLYANEIAERTLIARELSASVAGETISEADNAAFTLFTPNAGDWTDGLVFLPRRNARSQRSKP